MGKPHEQLDAWKESMQLVKVVYELTGAFPAEERFGLVSQMRRSAISVPSNLAEGSARNGGKEYLQFIGIARGSLAELDTQLQIAVMLGFMPAEHGAFQLADKVGKLLTGLHRKWTAI
jgi:four helix bundle protein